MTQIPTQQEIEKQIAIYGVAVIGENGELLDSTKLKVDDVSKKVVIVDNHSAGLTKSLLAAEVEPQTFVQVDMSHWDSRTEKERENPPKQIMKINAPLIQEIPMDIPNPKKRYNRRGKNNKYF